MQMVHCPLLLPPVPTCQLEPLSHMTRSTLSHTNTQLSSSIIPPSPSLSRIKTKKSKKKKKKKQEMGKWRRNSCLGKEIKLKASIPRLVSSVSSNHSSIHYHVKIPKSPCVHILNEEENEAQDLNPTSIPSVSS